MHLAEDKSKEHWDNAGAMSQDSRVPLQCNNQPSSKASALSGGATEPAGGLGSRGEHRRNDAAGLVEQEKGVPMRSSNNAVAI
jgi:hypothetical protein